MSGHGPRGRTAVGLASAARATGGGMLATALAVYVGRRGSPLAVGLLATAFFLAMSVFAPLWGAVGDATGRHRTLAVGLGAAATLVAGAFVLADSVWGLVALRGVYAAFAVGFGPLLLAVLSRTGGGDHRGRSAGFLGTTGAAGDVVGQAAVGVLLVALAPDRLFLVVAVVSLLATLATTRVDGPGGSDGGIPAVGDLLESVREQLVPDPAERATLRRTGLWALYGGLVLRHAAVKGVGSLLPVFLLARLGVSPVAMGLLLTLGSAAQVALNPVAGRLADAGGARRLVVGGMVVSGGYAVVLAAATLPGSPAGRLAVAAASQVAIAIGFTAMDVGCVALIGGSVPAHREAAFVGLRSTAAGAGGVVGPLVVGGLVVAAGYPAAFLAAGGLAIVAAAAVARWGPAGADGRPPGGRRSGYEFPSRAPGTAAGRWRRRP